MLGLSLPVSDDFSITFVFGNRKVFSITEYKCERSELISMKLFRPELQYMKVIRSMSLVAETCTIAEHV